MVRHKPCKKVLCPFFNRLCIYFFYIIIRHCFNDQTVSNITIDDIRKTYGGGPSRSAGYFTSAYTSSTNAYMLMYRRVRLLNITDLIFLRTNNIFRLCRLIKNVMQISCPRVNFPITFSNYCDACKKKKRASEL